MARTTLDLEKKALEELRKRSRQEHKSMGQVASELIARTATEPPTKFPPLKWHSQPMGPTKIDLEDKEAVWEILDGDDING